MNAKNSLLSSVCVLSVSLCFSSLVFAEADVLPSWNDGSTKTRIIDFVERTTEEGGADFVEPADRIATFDEDGTLWVEQPLYTQVAFVFDRIGVMAEENPELKNVEPFKTVLSGDAKKIGQLSPSEIQKVLTTAMTGMDLDTLQEETAEWIKTAKHERWDKLYTELTYLPQQELLDYLRDNGFKTYIVTGGGQNYVRVYSEETYGIPAGQVVGTAFETTYTYTKEGKSQFLIDPTMALFNDNGGKASGINLVIGKRPILSVGNSTGDREMLEYATSGDGLTLGMLVFHDDDVREYAYGPAEGLPNFNNIGAFTQNLYDEAVDKDWIVISMKNDWGKIFAFDEEDAKDPENKVEAKEEASAEAAKEKAED